MPDKKYQVFISSTYSDLKEERRKILDVLLMADCIPSGMEAFVATDNEQFEVIKKVIDLCDYYILIIGKRYGSVSSMTGKSYTEMEYDYAKSKGIPVLVFAIDESVKLTDDKTENDPTKIDLLQQFREKALNDRLATIWKTDVDLTGALAISIMRAQKEIIRLGWQRAFDFDEASLRREIMKLYEENSALRKKNDEANLIISEFASHDELAYEDYQLEISFNYFISSFDSLRPSQHEETICITLPELFEIIAIELINPRITERIIKDAIIHKLMPDRYMCSFSDEQLVKKILAQLKALGFIASSVDETNSISYWSLTSKGQIEADKKLLVYKN